jgi:hypothetical protein
MDTGGMLGPYYNYADELRTPSEIGVKRDGSFGGIMKAVGGINYYMDAIGFGEATLMAKGQDMNQQPLGVRYFIGTGATCSNGADMYEYISTIPNGLPGRVGNEIQTTLGVKFRGLAPGIMEDAVGALNPMPMFKAVTGSGYAQCKKVTLPVGDMEGNLRARYDTNNVWIKEPTQQRDGRPTQTRWVFDKNITMDEHDNTPKTETAGVLPEGFRDIRDKASSPLAAGVLFAALFLGVLAWKAVR